MGLVTGVVKTVEIPHDEGQSAVIKKLSHKKLKEAARERQREGVSFMKEIGAELMKALREGDAQQIKKIEDAQLANVNNYDRDTLLKLGIESWTYSADEQGIPAACDALDEETAAFLAEAVFGCRFSRPETEAQAKNG